MKGLANGLARTPVIILFLGATLAVGLSFQFVRDAAGGQLLDFIWSGQAAEIRLAEMSPAERAAHFWGTVINDTLYPLFYGGLLAGLAARFASPGWTVWGAVPALLTVGTDLCENLVQALALADVADVLWMKTVLTPLKFILLSAASCLAVGLALMTVARGALRGPER